MATATKKPQASAPPETEPRASVGGSILRGFDAVYHFLASVKLAVISLGTLASVLAYATFFEKWYGTAAVQEWIYRTKGFAILLAFLGTNILCAALIRFPWKKRQTGFVVTHAGLLLLLAGSWQSVMSSDEGQLAFVEGESRSDLIRSDYPVIRVQELDATNPESVLHEWELPFHPGTFSWGPGQPRPQSALASIASMFTGNIDRNPRERITRPKDPFQISVLSYLTASMPTIQHVADPSGAPMLEIRPMVKAPGMAERTDALDDADRWLVADRRFFKAVKSQRPARFAFYSVDRPELVDDFLNPPANPGLLGVARLRYRDKSDKPRTFDWALDDQEGKSVTLPDSELSVTLVKVAGFDPEELGLGDTLGGGAIPIAQFAVKKGDAEPVTHFGLASVPMFPSVIPSTKGEGPPPKVLVSINYDPPPILDSRMGGFLAQVDILATPEGKLVYRVFGRPEAGQTGARIREKGAIAKGQEIVALGGKPNMPMTMWLTVEDYLPAGVEKDACEPVVLPPGQRDNGIAASLLEITVEDPKTKEPVTKEVWVRRSVTYDTAWKSIRVGANVYRISFDVDREPLGFELKLDDFQRGFDPGTEQASRFSSDVRLTDKSQGVENQPHHIAMNETMNHRGYTFYQSSYHRETDPHTGRETGRFASILQVRKDPGRLLKYVGCIMVSLGAFLQFYMRAGLFTDGGKREREQQAKAAAKANGSTNDEPVAPAPATEVETL